jgi:transglutaminase-like putative cysteine protease
MSQPLQQSLSPQLLRLMLAAAVLALLPHGLNLPLAVSGLCLAILLLRVVSLQLPRLQPGPWTLMGLTLPGVLLVYSQHHTLIGRDAGISLLTLMLGMKLLELRKRRDVYVAVFISYFVVITQFLYSQSFLLTLYLLLVVVCLTALLMQLNRVEPAGDLLVPLGRTFAIGLQALPVAAILFFLFPRLSQPLWQFGIGDDSAVTGLSDRVSLGSISRLIQSPAVAFRARFRDEPAPADQRYWRGLVIWDTDGFEWFNRQPTAPDNGSARLVQAAQRVGYEIFLEAHEQHWLFALDLPEFAPPGSSLSADFTLVSKQPIKRPKHYLLSSSTRYRTAALSRSERRRALSLPDNITDQERDLVQRWRTLAGSERELVRLALQHFHSQPFVYTLTPPRYQDNPIHQFLFEGREGFCEHYASSFTLLMRLADIPARMVLGYQGGEYNPVGDYYILRQYDAHAWSEVWLQQQGWVRVDPTAAVAPERIRHGIDPEFAEPGSPVRFRLDDDGLLKMTLQQFGMLMDAANIGWRRWILDYSQARQFNLMRNLGLDVSQKVQWLSLGLGLIGLTLILIAWFIILKDRRREDPLVVDYQRLCNKLATAGLPRRPDEGPLDYSRRIARCRPDLMTQTSKLFDLYIRLRYGPEPALGKLKSFHKQVKQFRPSKHPIFQ